MEKQIAEILGQEDMKEIKDMLKAHIVNEVKQGMKDYASSCMIQGEEIREMVMDMLQETVDECMEDIKDTIGNKLMEQVVIAFKPEVAE
jgi:hypothetical protein